jgi:hypothetical protein
MEHGRLRLTRAKRRKVKLPVATTFNSSFVRYYSKWCTSLFVLVIPIVGCSIPIAVIGRIGRKRGRP